MRKNSNIENALIVKPKENIFIRFCKWVTNVFGNSKKHEWEEEPVTVKAQEITIPKAVKMPTKFEEPEELDENSLEYLYKLSDTELDNLDKLYDGQMEEAKNELLRLDNILQTYKQSIKKLQGQVAEEE